MTLRDVVPLLEELRQLTKVPLVAKQDTVLYKRIAEATSKLSSIDIDNAIIESHASGEIGKVQADQTWNYCAEIATRLLTFWNVFSTLDRERKNRSKAKDPYPYKELTDERHRKALAVVFSNGPIKGCRNFEAALKAGYAACGHSYSNNKVKGLKPFLDNKGMIRYENREYIYNPDFYYWKPQFWFGLAKGIYNRTRTKNQLTQTF